MRSKSSYIWNFFKEIPNSDKLAVCNECNQQLSFKATSNNLKKHMTRKHSFKVSNSKDNINEKSKVLHMETETIDAANTISIKKSPGKLPIQPSSQPQTEKRTINLRQRKIGTFLRKKMIVSALTMKRSKSSCIWNFFKEIPNSDKLAVCKLCNQRLSFKSTSNNLKKHMSRKHSFIKVSDSRDNNENANVLHTETETIDAPNSSSIQQSQKLADDQGEPTIFTSQPQTDKRTLNLSQTTIGTFLKKKMRVSVLTMKRSKSSYIWNFYKEIPNSDKLAVCNLCNQLLSFKSTTNNLKKHIYRKHSFSVSNSTDNINKNTETETIDANNTNSSQQSQQVADDQAELPIQPSTLTSQPQTLNLGQTTIGTILRKQIGVNDRKKIDHALLLLFTQEFQPLTLVEDVGFRKFVEALNPAYQLPSRKTITKSIIVPAYEEAYSNTIEKLQDVKAISLATECWTSRNNANFIAITGHYITDDFDSKSVLLDCSYFPQSPTSQNLAEVLNKVLKEWNLEDKILIVVSDNATNIVKAVKENLKLKHLGCFAHTVNLIAKDALELPSLHDLLEKIKQIVSHFKQNTSSMVKLLEQQKQENEKPKKLIQYVPTRWNSTFYMLERFAELEEAMRTTIALLNKDLPVICTEEWNVLRELIKILKPLETVTKYISEENYITASSIIVLTDGLTHVYSNLNTKEYCDLPKATSTLLREITDTILKGINSRLHGLENSNTLSLSTFLDPRYKTVGFSNEVISKKAKAYAKSLLAQIIHRKNNSSGVDVLPSREQNVRSTGEENGIWAKFDQRKNFIVPVGTSHSKAITEIQRYLDEPTIPRTDDPMQWWKCNSYNFPNLSELVKEQFVTVGTSVPCERLFSKSGQILSERRNRLGPNNVKSLLFLNSNK